MNIQTTRPRRMGQFILQLISIVCLIGFSSTATAVTIDTFLTEQANIGTYLGDGEVSASVSDPAILGGERDIAVEVLGIFAADLRVKNGNLFFDIATFGSTATARTQWDGADNSIALNPIGLRVNGVGVDFTENGAMDSFAVSHVFADHPYEFVIGVYTDATHWTEVRFLQQASSVNLTSTYAFSFFTDPALCNATGGLAPAISSGTANVDVVSVSCGDQPADVTNIGALQLIIDPDGTSPELDVIISLVETISTASCSGALGDTVWLDENHNGGQDSGEAFVSGATVNLMDATGNIINSGVTDANGNYLFENLCAGTYSVDVDETTVAANYSPIAADKVADTIDSDSVDGAAVDVILTIDNEENLTIDFGFETPCTGQVGNYIWLDTNRDGIQDAGEAPISGVTVNLYDGIGRFVTSQQTGADGKYLFSGLCPAAYKVDVDENSPSLTSFFPTIADTKGADGLGLDALDSDSIDGALVDVILVDDETNITIDFGFQPECTGKMGDYVWHDLNRNGIQDGTEPVLVGVRVVLNDAAGNLLAETITNASGFYSFNGLCLGTYTVDVDETSTTLAGFSPSDANQDDNDAATDNDIIDSDSVNGNPVTVDLPSSDSEDITIDFGFTTPCTASIGDKVWLDNNRNGTQDVGDTFISGATVKLLDVNGNFITDTVTNSEGDYLFSGLCTGEYSVDVVESTVSDTFFPTDPNVGEDALDSDSINGALVDVSLPSDVASILTIDFGFQPECTGKMGDYVWHDENRDGIQDGTEPVLAGVRVVLNDATGNLLAETTTNASGFYSFNGLCLGTYTVDVDETSAPLVGFVPTHANQDDNNAATDNDTVDSDSVNGNPVVVDLPSSDSEDITIDFGFNVPEPVAALCDIAIDQTCTVASQPSADELLCQAKIAATTLRYIGPSMTGATVKFVGSNNKASVVAEYTNVDLVSGVTVLTAQNGFTMDAETADFGAKTSVYIDGDLVEIIHTSCSAVYRAAQPAPLDGNSPNSTTGEKGEPSPNWYVINFRDKEGALVEEPAAITSGVASDACQVPQGGANVEYQYSITNNGGIDVNILSILDDQLDDDLATNPIFLEAGGSISLSRSAFISQNTTSLVAVVAKATTEPAVECPVYDSTIVTANSVTPPTVVVDEDCAVCDGKITRLTLQYNGSKAALITVNQKGKKGKPGAEVFSEEVQPGGSFEVIGTDKKGTLGTEITITVDGSVNTKMHTSCSVEIGPGYVGGDFEVIEAESRNGGQMCPVDSNPTTPPAVVDEDCAICDGKVTKLTLQYNGSEAALITVNQKGKKGKPGAEVFNAIVQPGQQFTFDGTDKKGTLGTEITITVDGSVNTKMHTSCSVEIGPGYVGGDFEVIEAYSRNGGKMCAI